MATQPDDNPGGTPDETPVRPRDPGEPGAPDEAPSTSPDFDEPDIAPDYDQPDTGPIELPPPD